MRFRLAQPEDAERLKEIFALQQVDAYLPLPGKDKDIVVAIVGEEEGVIEMAGIVTLAAEAHFVVRPGLEHGAKKAMELRQQCEGALNLRSHDMLRCGFPAILCVESLVPKSHKRMMDLMPLLGFEPEGEKFRLFFRRLGVNSNGT